MFALICAATLGRPTPLHCDRVRGRANGARSESPRLAANPRLPVEIALESAKRCDFTFSGGGSAPFAINGATFVDWAPKPAYVDSAWPARRVCARQQNGGRPGDPAMGPRRAALALDGRRLGALLARHHPHPARPDRPRRVRRRQPGQMAARNPQSPNIAQPEWELGFRWDEALARDGACETSARPRRVKRPPGNGGSANRRRPPPADKEWSRTRFRSPSLRRGALWYSCRKSRSRRPEAAAGS